MFNFLKIFERIGKSIQSELRRKMLVEQRGVDNRKYAPLKSATIRQKLKDSTATASKRMVRTKTFVNKAFQFTAARTSLLIFIAKGRHAPPQRRVKNKKGVAIGRSHTFRQLAGWHMGGNPDIPPTIFFPQNDVQINGLRAVKTGAQSIGAEAIKQAKQKFKLRVRAVLDVV